MPKRFIDYELYLVHVDPERCDGCEACLKLCPAGVFAVSHKATVVRPRDCLGCRTCEAVCKSGAIIITEI